MGARDAFPIPLRSFIYDAIHFMNLYMWQSQVENEVSGLIRLVISLECFIEITPDFLCPFMND